MIVTAAALCLILLLLAGGLALLEGAFRLIPWVLAVAAWALQIAAWLASAMIAVARAVRRRGATGGAALRTAG